MSIDRSKTLPIHEFPSLIDEVARLSEIEAKATGGEWKKGTREHECIAGNDGDGMVVLRITNGNRIPSQENVDLICGLRNAAPKLLDVLGMIRAGDASALEEIADILEEAGFVAKAAYVRRYRDMAQAMEGKL